MSTPIPNAELPYVTAGARAVAFTTLTPLYPYMPVVPLDREKESSIQELREMQVRLGHHPFGFVPPMPPAFPTNADPLDVMSKKVTAGCHAKLLLMLLPDRPRLDGWYPFHRFMLAK